MWYNISIMSNITTEDVQHLAQLSSISLGGSADVAALRQNLEDILHYIEQLSTLDTTGVEPTYQVTGLTNVWRPDTIDASDISREQLLALAAEQADKCVKVPKVL